MLNIGAKCKSANIWSSTVQFNGVDLIDIKVQIDNKNIVHFINIFFGTCACACIGFNNNDNNNN